MNPFKAIMPLIATLSSTAQATPPAMVAPDRPAPPPNYKVPQSRIPLSPEASYELDMKLMPQVPPDINAPPTPKQIDPPALETFKLKNINTSHYDIKTAKDFVDTIKPKDSSGKPTRLQHNTDSNYEKALAGWGSNIDRLNNAEDTFGNFKDIWQANQDIVTRNILKKKKELTIFPVVWKGKTPEEAEKLYNIYKEDRAQAQITGKNLGVDPSLLQMQRFHESQGLTKESGTKNFAGNKIPDNVREQLNIAAKDGKIDYWQPAGTILKLPKDMGYVTGGTMTNTWEGLDATTPKDAIIEAKKKYPGRWEPRQNAAKEPRISKTIVIDPETKAEITKYKVDIKDLFTNYNSMEEAGAATEVLLRKWVKPKHGVLGAKKPRKIE